MAPNSNLEAHQMVHCKYEADEMDGSLSPVPA